MKEKKTGNPLSNLPRVAILSFLISLVLCSVMIGAVIVGRERTENLQKEQLILEQSLRIQDALTRLFYKTEVLATLIRHGDGILQDFDEIAALIVDDPVMLNVLIAPGGVVTNAYSVLDDASSLIGHDFFSELSGNIEAMLAIQTGELVMAGPFMARQGYMVLAGRLPVFLDAEKTNFWGLVSVTLRFPEALDNAELGILRIQGYEYELWRINPDTGEHQILDSTINNAGPNARYLEEHIQFLNADWYLRLLTTRAWYSYPEVIVLILAGLFISLLVLFVAQNYFRLKQARAELAVLATTDPLTGIYNRRHFIELARIDIERARRFSEKPYVIIIDADYFKKVNDTYGHLVGDEVLIEITNRLKETIRPYDVLARYGGEEFIVYMPNSNEDGIAAAAERLRLNICETPFKFLDVDLNITASFGVSIIDDDGIEKAIKNADDALYRAKEEGRNRVDFHYSVATT